MAELGAGGVAVVTGVREVTTGTRKIKLLSKYAVCFFGSETILNCVQFLKHFF